MTTNTLRTPPRIAYVLLFALFSLPLVIKGDFLVYRNLHDFLMPYISAQALGDGLALHRDFHSPFGWVYHFIFYGLMAVIKHSNGFLETGALIYLACFVQGIALFALHAWLNRISPARHRISPWLTATTLCLCLALQHIFMQLYYTVTWYGLYNNFLAALIFTQAALWLQWRRIAADTHHAFPLPLFQAACWLQALILYITLHYKFSAFLAAVGFAVVLLFTLPASRRIYYTLRVMAVFLTGILLTALAGYDYPHYAQDVLLALKAQQQTDIRIFDTHVVYYSLIPLVIVCIALFIFVLRGISRQNKPASFFGINTAPLIAIGVAVSCFILARGSFMNPYIYPLAILCFFLIENAQSKALLAMAKGILITFNIICVLSCLQLAYNKTTPMPNYLSTALPTANGALHLQLKKPNYMALVHDDLRPDAEMVQFINLSVFSLAPAQIPFNVNGTDTAAQLTESVETLQKLGSDNEHPSYAVGFINPLPLLTGQKASAPAYQWLHPGINMPFDKLAAATAESMEKASFAVIPVATAYPNQQALNCAFYVANSTADNAFQTVKVTPNNIYLARQSLVKSGKLHPLDTHAILTPAFLEGCRRHLEEPKQAGGFALNRDLSYFDRVLALGGAQLFPIIYAQLSASPDFMTADGVSFTNEDAEKQQEDIRATLTSLSPEIKKHVSIIPVTALDHAAQRAKNCAFYALNAHDKSPALLFKISPYALYWAKKPYAPTLSAYMQHLNNPQRFVKWCSGEKP